MNKTSIQAISICMITLAGCAAQPTTAAPTHTAASANVCTGVASAGDDPFADPRSVISVQPLRETVTAGKIAWSQLRGANVIIEATPSMTKQWLARVAECHFSRHPLSSSPVLISVGETTTGFVVQLRTQDQLDRQSAEQILQASEVAWAPVSTRAQASR